MTREDAIEIIRKNMPSDKSLPVYEAIQTLIPELAENDDERIREEMIRYFTEMKKGGSASLPYDDCIAYLKQKEYKLTEEDKKIIPEALVMLCDDIINHRVHTPIKTDEEGARKIKAFLKTFNRQPYKTREEWEKLKEQKTADEAEKFFDSAESYNQGFVAGQKKMKEDIEKGFGISEHSLDYLAGRYAGYAAARQEQKPAEWDKLQEDFRNINEAFEKGKKEVVDNPERYGLCKPAEWSEEDNIGWEEAFACVTRTEKASKNEEELQNAVTAEKWLKEIKFKYYVHPIKQELSEEDKRAIDRACVALRAYSNGDLPEYLPSELLDYADRLQSFRLQSKQEWSEDERKILDSIIDDYEKAERSFCGYAGKIGFLRAIRDGEYGLSKQKWSEEDEDMLNSCISSIEEAKENRYAYKETDGDTSYDHEIAWLESLRNRVGKEFLQPHWKPSEEQMKAVKHAYNSFPNDCPTKSNLRLLYHDLEKLM